MAKEIILHISEVDIALNSGVGRVEYYWKKSFEDAGFEFLHIGPREVGSLIHKSLFPLKAYKYYKKLAVKPRGIIVHEPSSRYFVNKGIPTFIESHGIERRAWETQFETGRVSPAQNGVSLKTRLLFPLWRLNGCDIGLRKADKLLLINTEDKEYVVDNYNRHDKDIMVFKNGANIYPSLNGNGVSSEEPYTILFNGSWVTRKGIHVLIEAVKMLYATGRNYQYLLIGTGASVEAVTSDWPEYLKHLIQVHPEFQPDQELNFLKTASLFVLPSNFEGQPLSLLQAMAAGKCCITTNCCGQKDVIENGETGFLFEKGNPADLADLIIMCHDNPNLSHQIGENAKNAVSRLSWKTVADKVVDFVVDHSQ